MSDAAPVIARRPDLGLQLYKAGAIFLRDAKLAVSYEASFVVQWVGIFVGIMINYFVASLVQPSEKFGFAGQVGTYFNYLAVNLAFVRFQSTSLQSFAQVIREGQMQGTLEVVLSTPTGLSLIVLSGGLWAMTLTFAQTLVYLGLSIPFGLDLHKTNVLAAAVFLFLTVATLSPLGVMSAAITMVLKQTGPFDFVMTSLAYLFGGVYLPVAVLPHAAQFVAWILPITHALNGLRGAVAGATVRQLLPDALWLGVVTALLLPISLYLFDRAVRVAKIDGTLGQY